MSLTKYQEKRNFRSTPEPSGKDSANSSQSKSPLLYVIQKHRATQLHYDFRLEWDGVLLSWAVPKGPSPDPSIKRLAMEVEDHPIDYAKFEGSIPEGEYGGGTVMVWDQGVWTPEQEDAQAALKKGDFKFTLHGEKLHGSWVLVRTRGFGSKADKSWLLIKHRDKFASTKDVTAEQPRSVLTKRLLAEIARDTGGDVEKAATGDPQEKKSPRKQAGEKQGKNPKKARTAKK